MDRTSCPAGQVGLWAGSSSANVQADVFQVLSQSAVAEVDGRWYSTVGNVGIASGALRFSVSSASSAGGSSAEKLAIRRGFRGSVYVVQARVPTASNDSTGVLLHYQDPENYMAVVFENGGGREVRRAGTPVPPWSARTAVVYRCQIGPPQGRGLEHDLLRHGVHDEQRRRS
ncbi:MAG: hypothetical protein HZB38_05780 [Planctomycetes bacterium]|nr:hypothetical protein [Planctomycetota bacterium]